MFESLFDLPLLTVGIAIIVTLCLFAATGLMLVRRFVLPRLTVQTVDSDFTGAMLQSVMVFYGLAVALIAVSVWETYSDVSKVVSEEATVLATLYRDTSGYPDSIRPILQAEIQDYTHQIIYEAWPAQQRREIPTAGVSLMNNFQTTLYSFEPTTDSQKLLHAETLRAYNQLILARRMRLDAVKSGLPGVMWSVIVLGAFIGLSASFFFRVQDVRLHLIEVLLLAIFIGLIIFMILALDRPFRGDLGISPDSYQLIYDQLMKP